MSIFNRNSDKRKFVKKFDRLKKRAIVAKTMHKVTIIRIMSIFMVGLLVVGGGAIGISTIIPDDINNTASSNGNEMLSVDKAASAKTVDNGSAATSGSAAKVDPKSKNSGDINDSGLVVDAKAAVLMDAGSGTVLFSQNGADRLPPASVTKVMTMLLAMEAIDRGQVKLTDMVTISERAASMGGSQMYMEPGEQHPLEDLMKGISMVSANDACVAVAEYLSGSVEIFVENMNAKAKELGMENTHFANTNGLPVADHYTSAHDIAIMSCQLIKHQKTHDWFTKWQDKMMVGLPGKQTEFGLTNTNRLIKQYTGANGIKTGFTQEAGYCLSGSATRDDMTLIAVVLGCPSSKVRFAEAGKLLDYGFATYDTVKLAEKGEPNGLIEIEKGEPSQINAVAGEDISILVKKGEKDSVTFKVEQDKKIKAPVKKGDKVGEIVVYQDKKELGRYPLVAEESSQKASLAQLYQRLIKNLAQ
ncbi:D-alanyl-D-alanine carboxypeptidase family protein [Aminipila terrae]|uniref:serine-type D-Ala-D-Ala carboxypeptidase n=1 Tax=Aminipila terrae TaxID=2697030 RepID=A0A6P1MQU6_9FIRM|nr:D-alanyl-D-alanine carboxypeptidase family protein [Aminipila terrae]QHI73375.1 D-alanyl-D-alanine carboxypeptidase [Aminipila terrae]